MTQNLDKFEKEIEEIKRIELENTSIIKTGTDNKLIAEFMGMELGDDKTMYYDDAENLHPPTPINELKFHSSWHWLMPVIEKIGTQELTNTLSSTIEMLADYYYKDGDNQDGLEGIEEFYKAVVFWIENNQHLKTSEEMDLLDPVEDVSIFDVFMHINNENKKNKL